MALTQISTKGIKDGTITGTDLATNVDLVDNQKLRLGASQDLEIYHDGNHSYIQDAGTGNLILKSNVFRLRGTNDEEIIIGNENGNVQLYHENSKKFQTTSSGIEITSALGIANVGGTLAGSGGTENWLGIRDSAGNFQFAVKTHGTNNGSVGIGTTSPATQLEVKDSTDSRITITAGNAISQAGINFADNSGVDGIVTFDHNTRKLHLGAGTSSFTDGDLTIDSSGRVGIGTISPDGKLDVRGTIFVNGDGTGGRIFASSGNLSLSDGHGRQILRIDDPGSGNSHSHIFDSNGRLGISTTDPQSLLSVKVSASRQLDVIKDSGDDHLVLQSTAPDASFNMRSIELAGADVSFSTGASSGTSYTERMRITNGTNKEIYFNGNTNLPGLANTHTGMSFETTLGSIFMSRNNAPSLYVNNSGTGDQKLVSLRQNGTEVQNLKTQTMSYSSDEKVKKDIEALPIGLDFINKLEPKQFRYKFSEDTDPVSYGLIAQELEASLTSSGVAKDSALLCQYKALKETDNKDTSEYWIDYTKMIPVLIKAVQELTAKVEALEAG